MRLRGIWMACCLAAACAEGQSDGQTDGQVPIDATRDAGVDAFTPQWWNLSYRWRVRVRFSGFDGAPQQNVPLAVRLQSATFPFDRARADGRDLRFVDADAATVLPHEIERWDPDGQSVLWVNVPNVVAKSDFIWLYFGHSEAKASERPGALWNAYDAVLHMGTLLKDSTGTLTPKNNGTAPAPGVVGRGRVFSAAAENKVLLGRDLPLCQNVTSCTLSGWFNLAQGPPSPQGLAHVAVEGPESNDSRVGLDASKQAARGYAFVRAEGPPGRVETDGAQPGGWAWAALRADYAADTLTLFINGRVVDHATDVGWNQRRTPDAPAAIAHVGAEDLGVEGFFDGILDEVRISSTLRSDAWFALQHRAMREGFLSLEAPEERPSL